MADVDPSAVERDKEALRKAFTYPQLGTRHGSGSAERVPRLSRPKGREGSEDAFAAVYPELVRHYASVTERSPLSIENDNVIFDA
jgi:hypothetical protein